MVKLYESQGCDCSWEEIGNQVKDSPVKGYTLVSECAGCKTKREANAITMAKQKEAQDRQQKIAQRAQEDAWKKAEDDLKKEGKIV
jgi:hypothetical protein